MKNIKFSVYIPVLLAVALIVGILIGNLLSRNSGDNMAKMSSTQSGKLDAIINLIQGAYVDSISTDTLVEKTIPMLLKNLDPHTAYIAAKDMVEVEEEMRGNFGGIGVQFSIQNDTVMVVDVISGGPSSKLGIMPGDRIVEVNDTLLAGKGLKNEKVLSKLRGEKGTKVVVGIKRKGFKDLLDFEVTRGDIPIYSVDVSYIVYTKGNSQPKKVYQADSQGKYREKGVTILIDDFSASASEIFAGAIQDNDRGWIVGRRSFGKGLVQEQIPFNDGSAMRLTVARYYTPSGRCIQKPYDKGTDEYYKDIMTRAIHGEFQKADSIHYKDTLKYKTLAGRVVYGGGGIMPDYFIPADTLGYSDYYFKITQKGLVYQFALDYADSNRKILSKLSADKELDNYFQKNDVLKLFIAFSEKKGLKANARDLKTSSKIIDCQVKAYIARNIFGEVGFYPIIMNIDKTLLEAIEKTRKPIQQNLTGAVTK